MGCERMNYSICSVSFRHEMVSLGNLVDAAHKMGIRGIELWGVHAKAMLRDRPQEIPYIIEDMESKGLHISMISDYIDLCAGNDCYPLLLQSWQQLISAAQFFRTNKVRLFAGNKPSAEATEADWIRCLDRLRELAGIAADYGIYILIETHPNTFADTLESSQYLLRSLEHPHVCVNLDFLHLWEAGCDPLEAYHSLKIWTMNYHLKNVTSREHVDSFAPGNVFSPTGSRKEMCSLSEGAIDYRSIIWQLYRDGTSDAIALEWFGERPLAYLEAELAWLKEIEQMEERAVHGTTHFSTGR